MVHSLIETGAIAKSRTSDRVVKLISVVRHVAKDVDSLVKRDHEYLVTRPKLVNESIGSILNVFDLPLSRWTDIDHKDDCERLFNRLEITHLLLHAILKDLEISLL